MTGEHAIVLVTDDDGDKNLVDVLVREIGNVAGEDLDREAELIDYDALAGLKDRLIRRWGKDNLGAEVAEEPCDGPAELVVEDRAGNADPQLRSSLSYHLYPNPSATLNINACKVHCSSGVSGSRNPRVY